ncbi:hypothetical protein [Synechococcus sp. RS9916]|uniref:hypothetical protein n=1 Tax=Synechococcus sp. RS9916 TaxID=221359 RepID=UPI0012E9E372|nr:hypothetical protein [Synechococcus sp. RS9916]
MLFQSNLISKALALTILVLVSSREYGGFLPSIEHIISANSSLKKEAKTYSFAQIYPIARAFLIANCILVFIGIYPIFTVTLLVIAFLFLDYYFANLTPEIWPNFFHLHFIGICCIFLEILRIFQLSEMPAGPEVFTTVYWVIFIQISLIYFFSGLSKLIHGGAAWAQNAESLHLILLMRGSSLGKSIFSHSLSRRIAGTGTIVFELLAPALLLLPNGFLYLSVSGFLFHMTTYVFIGISFWHLWIFFPALILEISGRSGVF